MRIDIISCVPEIVMSALGHSIPKRAQEKGLAEVVCHNLHQYGFGNYKQVDDTPFGGGAGMVLMIEPIAQCIRALQAERQYDTLIYVTPDGTPFNQHTANQLSLKENILILCGHFKGVDERVRALFITQEISIGDYVLSGGELAAAVMIDAIVRLLPGVLSDETSALSDSFQDNLLAPPVYTRPADFEGLIVPEVLLGGNHKAIEQWRDEQSYQRTQLRRPDLLGE
jgi:tRNA (guanine37-N1)-methyltransferase